MTSFGCCPRETVTDKDPCLGPWIPLVHSGNSRGSKEAMEIYGDNFCFVEIRLCSNFAFRSVGCIDGALELADFDSKLMTVCNKTLNRRLTIFIEKKCFILFCLNIAWSFNIVWLIKQLIFVILFFNYNYIRYSNTIKIYALRLKKQVMNIFLFFNLINLNLLNLLFFFYFYFSNIILRKKYLFFYILIFQLIKMEN